MNSYVATLRALFDAPDDASALLIADKIRENSMLDLNDEEDSDDDVLVTQVTCNTLDISFEETLVQFKHTRNLLIKTRIKECYELAREFDKMIYTLEHRNEPGFELANYDYTNFIEIADLILNNNTSPIT
jgi:hypothetical protein